MLLTWQSRKLRRIVKSTLTAETLALQEFIEVAYDKIHIATDSKFKW